MDLNSFVRAVPDFPASGIVFRDITPLLSDPRAFREVVRRLTESFRWTRVDRVAGIESRGFLFAAPLALELGVGLVPIRKLGKLPGPTLRRKYALEYGTSELEMQRDAVAPGERVLLLDDVLATGGTARAAAELIEEAGATVAGVGFLIELPALGGRQQLGGRSVVSLLEY